jgi:hypothetical protein
MLLLSIILAATASGFTKSVNMPKERYVYVDVSYVYTLTFMCKTQYIHEYVYFKNHPSLPTLEHP